MSPDIRSRPPPDLPVMLIATLIVSLHLTASGFQLEAAGWRPIQPFDQTTEVVEADTGASKNEDTLKTMVDVGTKGHDLVTGVRDDSAARRADSTIGLTDEIALTPKAGVTPSITDAAGGTGDVAAKVAKRLRPRAGMLKIAIITLVVGGGIVAAVGATIAKAVSEVRKRSGARHDGREDGENPEPSAPTA